MPDGSKPPQQYAVRPELDDGSKGDVWHKEFPITSVTRADLVRAGARRSLARALSDRQMRAIATKMAEYYTQQGFWDHVKAATEYVLAQRQPVQPQQEQPEQELS